MTQKELTDKLDYASIQYYNGLTSEFSDIEFDLKLKELQTMEKESGVVYSNSPTLRVGSDIQDGFKKGEHPYPMFTIENTYDDKGLSEWVTNMVLKYNISKYNVSIKYDGVSCELWYLEGKLIKALTRGDKIIGDDITENVKTIKNVPLQLFGSFSDCEMTYVRGEILMPKSRLNLINEQRIKENQPVFANTRNACSGSIKQLDPKITASRGLIFKAWDVFGGNNVFNTMSEKIDYLEQIGFYYEKGTKPFMVDIDEILTGNIVYRVSKFKEEIDLMNLDFDYDGIVIKIDNVHLQDIIGTKDTRAIEWGVARKWNEENEVETVLTDVEWQVGRTGVLTPVGRLVPVECNGVVISNVTLHNMDFIKSMGINIGDVLRITRSGGVIPYVIGRKNGEYVQLLTPPKKCSVCGGEAYVDGALIKCSNRNCSAKTVGKIIQFCSKDCMDIRSIGDVVANDLVEKNIINSISDIYTIKNRYSIEMLIDLLGAGYGKKSVEKMILAIEDSKKKPFANVLAGLSIPNVGKVVARQLAQEFKTIDKLMSCTYDELVAIDGIGEIMADEILVWFNMEENINICKELIQNGLVMKIEANDSKTVNTTLNGLTICFTGASNRFKGDEVEKFLEENGAKCVHSVSKKLNYLIIGDKPGSSKVKKAEENNVTIITEKEFYNKYSI